MSFFLKQYFELYQIQELEQNGYGLYERFGGGPVPPIHLDKKEQLIILFSRTFASKTIANSFEKSKGVRSSQKLYFNYLRNIFKLTMKVDFKL